MALGPFSQHDVVAYRGVGTRLIALEVAQQGHRQPIHMGKMVEVGMGEKDFVYHVYIMRHLEFE